MKIKILSLLLVFPGAFLLAQSEDAFAHITGYAPFLGQIQNPHGGQSFVLRRFSSSEGKSYYLSFDPYTLQTAVVPKKGALVDSLGPAAFFRALRLTPYGAGMNDEMRRSGALQDAGLTHTNDPFAPGINLTIDLCPSRLPLARDLFTRLIDSLSYEERPVPVSIAITGVWMEEHPADLAWLKTQEWSGNLCITWVNHSYHHRYDPKLPMPENFLLEKHTDIKSEVLENERAMLEHGLIPSLFFRFPGLVSDLKVFAQVEALGLLPIGSDAWLAKGQQPENGSIVLVHGNGNEPLGVSDFLHLLARKSPLIHQHHWLLLDLGASVVANEEARH